MSAVRVLYFAGVRDLVGAAEEELELPEAVLTLEAFVPVIVRAHPQLEGRLVGVRFAINETFAAAADPVAGGDVVAVIPPVAGG